MLRIVNYSEADEENYGYALCYCCQLSEGIEIPRPEHTKYIRIKCPRCGSFVGITLLGKEEKKNYLRGLAQFG